MVGISKEEHTAYSTNKSIKDFNVDSSSLLLSALRFPSLPSSPSLLSFGFLFISIDAVLLYIFPSTFFGFFFIDRFIVLIF